MIAYVLDQESLSYWERLSYADKVRLVTRYREQVPNVVYRRSGQSGREAARALARMASAIGVAAQAAAEQINAALCNPSRGAMLSINTPDDPLERLKRADHRRRSMGRTDPNLPWAR